MLELKSRQEDFIVIENRSYTKNDLLERFDFFEDDENWEMLTIHSRYHFLKDFENLYRISCVLNIPQSFIDEPSNFVIRNYLTNTFHDTIQREIRRLLENDDFVQLRMLASYFELLTGQALTDFHALIKSQIERKLVDLEKRNYVIGRGERIHFVLTKYFVELVGLVGNDDPYFIVDALNAAIFVRNKNKVSQTIFISCLRTHLTLDHSPENRKFINDVITRQKKVYENDDEKTDAGRIIWAVIVVVIFIFRLSRCNNSHSYTFQGPPRNYNFIFDSIQVDSLMMKSSGEKADSISFYKDSIQNSFN